MAENPFSEFLSGVKKLWFVSTGAAAHDAAASGNPVQVGGVYRATDPAVADGDVASLRVNAKGEAIVSLSGSKAAVIKTWSAQNQMIAASSQQYGDTTGALSAILPLNVSAYKSKLIKIANNYDAQISYAIYGTLTTTSGLTAADRIELIATTNLAAGAVITLDPITYPKLNMPLVGLVISMSRVTAPTTGTMDILIAGGVI